MKHIIILGDGMSDHPVEKLGGKTLLHMQKLHIWISLLKKEKRED